MKFPVVGIVMGSDSDLEIMSKDVKLWMNLKYHMNVV